MVSDIEFERRWVGIRTRLDAVSASIVLVAVTKTFPADAWAAVIHAGGHDVGENYAQELLAKSEDFAARFPDLPRPRVHFIGRLQSNKVRSLSTIVDLWQTVDRSSLLREIAKWAPGAHVLVQTNLTGEIDKGGCTPDQVASLVAEARHVGLVVEGLMVVGPTDGDPERTREAFERLTELADREMLAVRSMGMSADLETALEEGSTMVRVGSVLFGDRPPTG